MVQMSYTNTLTQRNNLQKYIKQITVNKIYIYKAEVLKKHEKLQDKVVNYVKLTRPEGLEEHWPKAGDIVNLYLPNNVFYMKHKVIGKQNDDIYIIETKPHGEEIKYDVKIENLKYEGLECLLHLPKYINDEVKVLSKLTKMDADINKSLILYFDISKNLFYYENFDEVIKTDVIRAIKDVIKDNDFYIDTDNYSTIEVYTNEPLIEEVIDKYPDGERLKFNGIIEKENKVYRLIIRTNIYKKNE